MTLGLERFGEFEKAFGVRRELGEAGLLDPGLAIAERIADGGERQGDELAVLGLAVGLQARIPAAVLRPERAGDVRHLEELVRVLERVVEPHQHDVRPRADVCRHRRFRAYVLPAFLVDADIDAGRFRELLGVRDPLVLVALDEGRPAQDAQGRARLGLEGRRRSLGEGRAAAPGRRHSPGRETGAAEQDIAPGKGHVVSSNVFGLRACRSRDHCRRRPVSASNRWVAAESGAMRMTSPGFGRMRSRNTQIISCPPPRPRSAFPNPSARRRRLQPVRRHRPKRGGNAQGARHR